VGGGQAAPLVGRYFVCLPDASSNVWQTAALRQSQRPVERLPFCGRPRAFMLAEVDALKKQERRASATAAKWLNDARKEAVETDAEKWERCRKNHGWRG
jgi:hypothetical protein